MDGQTVALLVVGVLVGGISGMLGIGGAVMLVPILAIGFGFSQAKAQGTSLGALVPPIGIFAAIQYYRNGLLDIRASTLIACGFILGAFGGASLVPHIPQAWLKRAFATLLIYVAMQLMFADPNKKLGAVLPGAIAVASLWILYAIRVVMGKKPKPPTQRKVQSPVEYHI